MKFTIYGHRNVLCSHKSTLEFTKDTDLTHRGDCILGVAASFDAKKVSDYAKTHTAGRLRITTGTFLDELDFEVNQDFCSDGEIVIRLGSYSSKRTLGIRATKSAAMVDRRIVRQLQQDGSTAEVELL